MKHYLTFTARALAIVLIAVVAVTGLWHVPVPASWADTATPPVGSSVDIVSLSISNDVTTSQDITKIKMPYKAKLLGAQMYSKNRDATTGDETYTMYCYGSTIGNLLTPTLINTTTVKEATIVNSVIPDEETITCKTSLGGTTPILGDIVIHLFFGRM